MNDDQYKRNLEIIERFGNYDDIPVWKVAVLASMATHNVKPDEDASSDEYLVWDLFRSFIDKKDD